MKYGEGYYLKYKDAFYTFYISGESQSDWTDDYFVIDPVDTDEEEDEYYNLKQEVLDKIKLYEETKAKKGLV